MTEKSGVWVGGYDIGPLLEAAVAEEREACAKVADQFQDGPGDEGPGTAIEIAVRIRLRSGVPPVTPGEKEGQS